MSTENVKKKTYATLTTDQRLDRLERLVVKALMSLGNPNPSHSRLITTDRLPLAQKNGFVFYILPREI
ncbi:unnamed protein product [marine sediment metagenome]|uniref:Uncharacterized protein n=1 Tax=marine sediment metagenome TaxID=412755 RepID=X0W0X2_9ZZZZ